MTTLVSDESNNKVVLLMMDIYQLAVQYLIPRLEHVSIQYLELKISKTNVLDALYYADKMKYVIFPFCTHLMIHLLCCFRPQTKSG